MAIAAMVLWLRERRRLDACVRAERSAVERRDRLLSVVTSELDGALSSLRGLLEALERAPGRERARAALRELDDLRARVVGVGRHAEPSALEEVELADLVREILDAPPFSDEGPPVILRAGSARARADRAQLSTGLRVLLWVLRRQLDAEGPLVVTVGAVEDRALVELESFGAREAAAAVERLPEIVEGLAEAPAPRGTTLAVRVADEVARLHGGRLHATARAGAGERFVLELPRA